MKLELTETERQLQKQRRDEVGYVKVTVVLILDAGWGAGQVAQALGLDDGTVYRYVQAWQRLSLEKYLLHEAPGYWGLLPSAGLAALSREVEQTLYTDVRALGGWLRRYWGADCVNAQSTKALYEKLLAAHPEGQPIYVICDNARYYRNRELAEWLTDKPLVFLPPYSPDLNLIERLWRFLRQKIINPCFYRTKGAFRQAKLGFFRLDEFGHDLASLLTLKFHLFPSQTSL
jgi:transposase